MILTETQALVLSPQARDASPLTSRLKPLDVAFMKAIHNKVNIVPVIAKADTLTLKERERLKKRVSSRWGVRGRRRRSRGGARGRVSATRVLPSPRSRVTAVLSSPL